MYTCFVWDEGDVEFFLTFTNSDDAHTFGKAALLGRDVTHYSIDDAEGEEIFTSRVK